jgi:hypothetical protein
VVPDLGETRAADETDITGANDTEIHRRETGNLDVLRRNEPPLRRKAPRSESEIFNRRPSRFLDRIYRRGRHGWKRRDRNLANSGRIPTVRF